jgi:hypothetical protein
MKTRVSARQCSPKTPQSMQTPYELHNFVIEVVEEQIAYGNSYLAGNQHSERSSQTFAGLTLPSNLVQKVNHNLALIYPHTVEVLPHRIGKLFLALPAFLLPSGHRWRQFSDRGTREYELVVRLIKGRRCIQSIVVSIAVQDRRIEGGPLELWLQC